MDAEISTTTDLSRRCHPACLVCGNGRPDGLALRFEQQDDGGVAAEFDCSAVFQGYPDRLHGGVVSMLLDAAMTHCLFARRIAGLTAKLSIRYRRAVGLGVPAAVRARLVDAKPPLYYLESEVVQGGDICAAAKGTFWDSACGDLIPDSSSGFPENPAIG
ncbi:MAG: PaaI family thioesterase [Phycisphaerae bacterium]